MILDESFVIQDFKTYYSFDNKYFIQFNAIEYDKYRDFYVVAGYRVNDPTMDEDRDAISLTINALNNTFIRSYVYNVDSLFHEYFQNVEVLKNNYIFSGYMGSLQNSFPNRGIFEVKTLSNLNSGCRQNRHRVNIESPTISSTNPTYTFTPLIYTQNFYNHPKKSVPFKQYIECIAIYPSQKTIKYNTPTGLSKLPTNPSDYIIYDVQGRKVNKRIEDLPNYTLYLIHDLENNKIIKLIKQ